MLTKLPEHFQVDFGDNWNHLLQQKESRLEGRAKRSTVKGKEKTTSQLGKSKMRMVTTRNGKTIPSDTPMAKRWLRPIPYDEVTYIDEFDHVALGDLPAPTSEHVTSHAMAAKRTMDEVIIAGLEGTAYVGETGVTAVDLGNSQKVAVDYVASGSAANSGLTLAKLIRAKYILDKNEVPAEGRTLVISAMQQQNLLRDADKVSDADYADVKALVEGKVTRFLGFDFIVTEQLTLNTGTDVRTCIAYQRDGIELGIGKEKAVNIDVLPGLSHTVQIRTTMLLGATRLEEEAVVLIYCDESP